MKLSEAMMARSGLRERTIGQPILIAFWITFVCYLALVISLVYCQIAESPSPWSNIIQGRRASGAPAPAGSDSHVQRSLRVGTGKGVGPARRLSPSTAPSNRGAELPFPVRRTVVLPAGCFQPSAA